MGSYQIKMGTAIADYHQVRFDLTAMLSPMASVIGDVSVGAESSIFAGVHIRGDCESIAVGSRTNIQENSCLHVSVGSKLVVGDHVTVGHNVTLHGCTIEDNVLVGMGSIVMDDAHIGRDCVVGAGSLVTQGKEFPPGSLIVGSPARVVRTLSPAEIESLITVAADAYIEVAQALLADGLMFTAPPGASIWPAPGFFGAVV